MKRETLLHILQGLGVLAFLMFALIVDGLVDKLVNALSCM